MMGFPGGLEVKNQPANAGDMEHRFDPWVGKIPWRRTWRPAAVFLPGKAHGQRSLVGCCPWGCKELDMIYRLNNNKQQELARGTLCQELKFLRDEE